MGARPSAPGRPGEDGTEVFAGERHRLLGIAYRMLGSWTEAEDVVQDVWLRWNDTDRDAVVNPPAFLTTATVRMSINVLQSARWRRESYVGAWLPEPVSTAADPTLGAERGEALELGVLLMLERLSPTQRAAYVLREAFDYPYPQIATMLDVSEANARQLVSRAGKHISDGRRQTASRDEHARLLATFLDAARNGELEALERLFSDDIVSISDGGGFARAARSPIVGTTRVARFIAGFANTFWAGLDVAWIEANGKPVLLLTRDGVRVALVSVHVSDRGIDQILWFMNPSKLTMVGTRAAPDS